MTEKTEVEKPPIMNRNMALDAVRVTEATALSLSRLMGCGDEKAAYEVACSAMHRTLDGLEIDATVAVGVGEAGDSPKLFNGERLGARIGHGTKIDIAVEPLDGCTTLAKGGNNVISVVALARRGGFFRTPDVYMDKIAVGGNLPKDVVDLDAPPAENLRNLALAKNVDISDLVVCVLDRPRHENLIGHLREAGARVTLIDDGDVSAIIATAQPQAGVDLYYGIGGAPEGVLAAAALRCSGGQMQGRLVLSSDSDRARVREAGIEDPARKLELDDLVYGDMMFAATGITDGSILPGVRRDRSGHAVTHSLVMRSNLGTVRFIEAHHDLKRKLAWLGL